MGFFHQLRLLLWKNLTLKKRRPLVLLFELCIPLVLFFILLAIRKKQPATPKGASHFIAKPLPSAGVVSILQAFCEGSQTDEYGFPTFPNSTLGEVLDQFNNIAEHNNFFDPGFTPDEMSEIPDMYKSIIEDPIIIQDKVHHAKDTRLGDLVVNPKQMKHFLVHNLSLSEQDADVFLNSTINTTKVYHVLFGEVSKQVPYEFIHGIPSIPLPALDEHPKVVKRETELDNGDSVVNSDQILQALQDMSNQDTETSNTEDASESDLKNSKGISSFLGGLMEHIQNPQKINKILDSLNLTSEDGIGQFRNKLSPDFNVSDIKKHMTPETLEKFKHILSNVNMNTGKANSDQEYQSLVKSLFPFQDTTLNPQEGLIYKLLGNVQDQRLLDGLSHILGFGGLENGTQNNIEYDEVLDLAKEVLFSPDSLRYIVCIQKDLSDILITKDTNQSDVTHLQQSLCNLTSDQLDELSHMLKESVKFNVSQLNFTAAQQRVSKLDRYIKTYARFQKNLLELSKFATVLPQDACVNTDQGMGDVTTVSIEDQEKTTREQGDHGDHHHHHHQDNKGNNPEKKGYPGLLKIWMVIQKSICGVNSSLSPQEVDQYAETKDYKALGLSQSQKFDMGILINTLYKNPKVLYAPNNTDADKIVKKANATFALFDKINEYAKRWMNVSASLRKYLNQTKTEDNLESLRQMQAEMRAQSDASPKGFIERINRHYPAINTFAYNITIPHVDNFLEQLDIIDSAACSWTSLVKGINFNVFQGFKTETELVTYTMTKAYFDNVTVFSSIVFENMNPDGSLPPHIVYKIRQNSSFTETTKDVRPRYWYPGNRVWGYKYYYFGFVWIQDIIDRAIIDLQTGLDLVQPGSYIHQFPYPCFMNDKFLLMIEHVMPLCLTISWVYSVAMLVQNIVYEKEQRLKEVMKMMGLNNAVHWLAWFITSFLQMTVTMGIVTVILKYGEVLTYSDPWLVFFVLESFAVATISFSFFVSVLYSKAKLAAACAGIIYFLTYVPYMYIAIREEAAGDNISSFAKSVASLMSTTAFGLGAKYFALYEEEGVGVQWNNMDVSPVEDDEFNLYWVTVMMIVDTLLYLILVWYIENVHPGSYGLPKPWYFPFLKSYWCNGVVRTEMEQCNWKTFFNLCRSQQLNVSVMEEDQACAMEQRYGDEELYFERDPDLLPLGVCIDNLVKIYKSGKLAVNKLSLNLYEGQITSFLGHNGAGKTTTMSILTGLFPPSAGFATIYGHDIRTEMEEIRKSLGMCPQHNVLFDKLTVEEHLWFYARLKGMKHVDIKSEMESMIHDMGLPKKRNSMVDCLSGGMKRKLSVAIAFVAGSRTVILDEPTAGVDPYARRAIWDLLIKYKEGRTILLSTHHMDEAEILGDRIGIISNGQLKCCGSPLFLKSTFGDGYHLSLVKKPTDLDVHSTDTLTDNSDPLSQSQQSFITKCSESAVTAFITSHVSTAYIIAESNHELQYILPFEEAKKGNFEKLFQALDNNLAQLELLSYGVRDTTLEEVFLKVTAKTIVENEENTEKENATLKPSISPTSPLLPPFDDVTIEPGSSEVVAPDNVSLQSENSMSHLLPGSHMELGSMSEIRCDGDPEGGCADEGTALDEDSPRTGSFYSRLINQEESTREVDVDRHPLEGAGSYRVTGNRLRMKQLVGVIVKRFHYIRRNWKGLFSQILLPAMFVCIAMTVALTAPKVEDLPPLVLSPAQYYNYTQPRGNFVPYNNEALITKQQNNQHKSKLYINSQQLIHTFYLPSGLGATCVLKKPFNNSFDADILKTITQNYSSSTFQLLSRYFEPGCESVFVHGLPLSNFVPPPPTAAPTPPLNLEANGSYIRSTVKPNKHSHRFYPICHCADDGTGYICPKDGYYKPGNHRLATSDVVIDISGQNTSEYILYTTNKFRLHRYGALSFGNERTYVPENFGRHAPTLFKTLAVRDVNKVWYNQKGFHSMPTYLNVLNNAILRASLPQKKGNPAAYGITVINHPMNDTNNQLDLNYILQGSDVLIAIFIIAAMSFVPASFVLFLVYERSTKSKHLQFVSGIDPVVYWLANYIWDMCNYVIPMACCIIILRAFDIPAYVGERNFPAVLSLFLLYGWSITPMMYPISFVFKEPSAAYIFLIVINLFIGITCIITSFLLDMFDYDKDLYQVHKVVKQVFLIFPNYDLGRGLMDIAFNEYYNQYYIKTGQYNKVKSPFEWELMARNLVAMAAMGVIFFIITILCEYRFFFKTRRVKVSNLPVVDEDTDVNNERRRVLRGNGKNDVLCLENITKVYKTRKLGRHLAVDKLCLGVPQGECFGLLGVNGAGKTTTFKMLTGDITPSSGDAFVNGHSILKDMLKVQQNIGYCPQFDALYEQLTAREHLHLYARLRGVPYKEEKKVVEWALQKLSLTQYADKPSGTYSGGNKRKLSTAIALLGHPQVIFLDEPTTGMDPHSRRFLWDLITSLVREGRSVVLTSHSMEECEALCTRMAIMVNGKFKCMGSSQHLKNKFGKGYTITLRVKGHDLEREVRATKRYVERHFPDAVLKEEHHNIIQYELCSESLSLARVFSKMEEGQTDLHIEDYSVCQNTLDNVFINFVKHQSELMHERGESPTVPVDIEAEMSEAAAEPDRVSQSSTDSSLLTDGAVLQVIEDDGDVGLELEHTGSRLTFMNMEIADC